MERRNLVRFAGVFAVLAASLMLDASPAQAQTAGTITFQGLATVTCPGYNGGGLSYPIATDPPTKPFAIKKAEGRNCLWTFSPGICTGVVVNKFKSGKDEGAIGDCTITASGNLTGWCGLSNGFGSGSAKMVDEPTQIYTLTKLGFKGIGGTLLVHAGVTKNGATGPGAQKGVMDGEVNATPDPAGGSCTNKTATGFIISGTADFTMSGQTVIGP